MLVNFFFVFQALLSTAATAAAPLPDKCINLFSQAHSIDSHSPYQLIQFARGLSEDEQIIFLNKIQKDPIPFNVSNTQDLNSVLKLALQDPVEWERLFRQIHKKGLTFFQVKYLITLLKEESPRIQNRVLHFISKNYRTSSKITSRSFDFSPKNSLDILLGILIPPEDFFNQSPHNPLGAYRRYIDAKKKILRLYNKEKTYDLIDIKAILQQTQEILHKENPIEGSTSVTLFGSFINGTAFLETSDLDMTSSHLEFSENTFYELFNVLEKNRKFAAIDFIFTPDTSLGGSFGLSSPLQIRITKNKILFLVFPLNQTYKNLSNPSVKNKHRPGNTHRI